MSRKRMIHTAIGAVIATALGATCVFGISTHAATPAGQPAAAGSTGSNTGAGTNLEVADPTTTVKLFCPANPFGAAAGYTNLATVTASQLAIPTIPGGGPPAPALTLAPPASAQIFAPGSALEVRTNELAHGQALTVNAATTGDYTGLALGACTPPVRRAWYVGGQSIVGASTIVQLANLQQTPATVTLTIYTEAGAVGDLAPVTVGPGQVENVLLEALAPAAKRLAFNLRVQGAPINAAVFSHRLSGLTPHGVAAIEASQAPAKTLTIAGWMGEESALRIVNPATTPTQVRIAVGTAAAPAELPDVITVAPEAVTDIPLGQIGAGPGQVIIDADQPVSAALHTPTSSRDSEAGDSAWFPALPPATPAETAAETAAQGGAKSGTETGGETGKVRREMLTPLPVTLLICGAPAGQAVSVDTKPVAVAVGGCSTFDLEAGAHTIVTGPQTLLAAVARDGARISQVPIGSASQNTGTLSYRLP